MINTNLDRLFAFSFGPPCLCASFSLQLFELCLPSWKDNHFWNFFTKPSRTRRNSKKKKKKKKNLCGTFERGNNEIIGFGLRTYTRSFRTVSFFLIIFLISFCRIFRVVPHSVSFAVIWSQCSWRLQKRESYLAFALVRAFRFRLREPSPTFEHSYSSCWSL